MQATVEQLLTDTVFLLKKDFFLPNELDVSVQVIRSKKPEHGDFFTPLAFSIAKLIQCEPHVAAEKLIEFLPAHPSVRCVQIAEPGFVNFFMTAHAQGLIAVLDKKVHFDRRAAVVISTDIEMVKYAQVRLNSIFEQLEAQEFSLNAQLGRLNLDKLQRMDERSLLRLVEQSFKWFDVALTTGDVYQLAKYLRELANCLHNYFNAVPILCESETLRSARLLLLVGVGQVLRNGMALLGVSALERI